MNNAQKYIDTVADIYGLDEETVSELQKNSELIEKSLTNYYWEDIKQAIDYFYVRKTDKSRPRLSQIISVLETWVFDGKINKVIPDEEPVPEWKKPTTKIFSIAATFDKLIETMMNCGIIVNPHDVPERFHYSLVDENGVPILGVNQWLKWQVDDAVALRPDIFAPFPYATFWEKLALACQNKLVVLRTKNWSIK